MTWSPLRIAADRLDVPRWPAQVVAATRLVVEEADHAASCPVCPASEQLPAEVVAVFTEGVFHPGWAGLADAIVELADVISEPGCLRRCDRRPGWASP